MIVIGLREQLKKHDNLKVFLCGKCIITLIVEGTDREQVDIYQYLTDSLTNNRKITELCLVHRLFASSSQLMQLLINSFCQNMEESETAGMLKVINFVIKWVNFLWFEDFKKTSKSRLLLNKFISFLLEQTNGKNNYGAIWKATQKLLAHYRDQYLLQQQIDSELEANLMNNALSPRINGRKRGSKKNIDRMGSIPQNITSKAQLQNSINNYFSDEYDSDENQYFQHDLFQKDKQQQLIPGDLAWFEPKNDENKQKFFHYILQKRNSIDQFRKYQSKEVQTLKKAKSSSILNINIGDPNVIDNRNISMHKSMPFKSMRNTTNNNKKKTRKFDKHSRQSSKSIHLNKDDFNGKRHKKSNHGSDSLNVIKSYEIKHSKSKSNKLFRKFLTMILQKYIFC